MAGDIQASISLDVSGVEQGVQAVSKSLSNLKPITAQATNSLNALSQVARDAPFGFIAIQNNLPILFDQFGALTKASGGVVGAFKNIGGALAGPAGVTFAIGAVISGITVLTQKYGSIGNAIDVFIGKTISATDIQNKYNDSLEDTKKASSGEITNLNSLVNILTNVNSTREQQVGAFNELNKTYPALLTNIKLENVGTADSIQLIKARTELIGKQIILEGRREALIKLIGEAALDGEKALSKFTSRDKLGFFDKLGLEIRGLFAGIGGLGAINILNADLGNAVTQTEQYSDILKNVNTELAGVNGQIDTIIANYRKQQKGIQDSTEANKDWATQSNKSFQANADFVEQQKIQSGYWTDNERLIKANTGFFKIWVKSIQESRRKALFSDFIPKKLPTLPDIKINTDNIKRQKDVVKGYFDEIKQKANFSDATTLMQNTFFNPLTDLFDNFIQTGRFAFKEFANAILKAISQIVAKIIATGIIVLLASILFPGAGGIGATFGANIGSAISSAIGIGGGFGGGNRVAAPTFNGVRGGSMQMAGAVNLQLRGSDLVGAINRTNATINRVG